MKRLLKNIMMMALLSSSLFGCGCEKIDAGHVGIEVALIGSEKGVQDVTQVTGIVWYNPYATEIYEFPTFVQNSVYAQANSPESPGNQEFRVTTKDGLGCGFDVSINYKIEESSVVGIFKKYRRPLGQLNHTIIKNYLRQAFNKTASKYTAEDLYQKREQFQSEAEKGIRQLLEPEGFKIEQVVLLGEIRLPKSVRMNIEAKVNAKQLSLKKQEELAQTKADAEKQIAQAEGRAKSLLIQADAEAKANKLRQQSLTPLLVQQQWIEAWKAGGSKMPQYVGGDGGNVLFTPNFKRK